MSILQLDTYLTVAINSFHAEWADGIFYYLSQTLTWLPLALLLLILGWRQWGWRRLIAVVAALLLCLLISDQLCNLIKITVCRLRPTHEPSLHGTIHTVRGYLGGDYGFCSAHACNTCSVALFTSLIVRRMWYSATASLWVLLNCWSRIYLGVHYLGDILGGLLLGAAIAALLYFAYNHLIHRHKHLFEK